MKTVKLILINLLLLLVLLAIIDPFLAPEKKQDKSVYRNLKLRELGPNRQVTLFPANHGIDTTRVESNSYSLYTDNSGFIIGPNDDQEADADIIFFGGSTTECAFVDDSLRYPYLVGQHLGVGVVTKNAGNGGNHSFHSLTNLIGKGLNPKPKTVVWMHNINDLALLSKTGSYFISPNNRRILYEDKVNHSPSFLSKAKKTAQSAMLLFYSNTYNAVKKMAKPKGAEVDEWAGYRNRGTFAYNDIEKLYKSSLQSFIGVAKAHDIEVVLMTQFNRITPNNAQVEEELMRKHKSYTYAQIVAYYQGFNQVIRDVAQEQTVQLIDLDKQVPKQANLFYDAVHLNNAGSKLVAQLVFKALQEQDTTTQNNGLIEDVKP